MENFLSVDLEDWHTSAYLRKYVTKRNKINRIDCNTKRILDLFDKVEVKATFFVLGSVAKENIDLIKEIHSRGHELASHGYSHTPLWDLNKQTFIDEIRKTNELLENISNKKTKGFRAPYASLNKETSWSIDVLEEEGFLYDSSIFPMKTPLYGEKNAPEEIYNICSKNILHKNEISNILEIPFTVYNNGGIKIPCTGGIYGRFLPFFILKNLLKKVEKQRPINFYFHPWEIDENPPHIKAPFYNKFVSYYNSSKYLDKIESVLKSFSFTSFERALKL